MEKFYSSKALLKMAGGAMACGHCRCENFRANVCKLAK